MRVNGRTADTFASLEGKTALVTGGSRGIGRAIALELARAGATVTLSYRSGKDEAEAVAQEAGAKAIQADVASADEAKRLVDEAGELDVLVNNAGITRDGLLARMPDDDWSDVIATNLGGVFHTCRAAARGMMKRHELFGVEGRDHRLHEGVGSGARQPRRACKRRRAGVCRHASDRGDRRGDEGVDAR